MFGFGKKQLHAERPKAAVISQARVVRAKYDAAMTGTENARHWANADYLSPDLAASPEVRRNLRSRARYEVANNSFAKGMVLTLSNDCIGTGPRLQLQTPDVSANRIIETLFADWAGEVGLAAKLRTARMARSVDGEAFGLLVQNPMLRSPIKLDVKLVEAEQITTPYQRMTYPEANYSDGVVFDRYGNRSGYFVLRNHPSGSSLFINNDFDLVPASHVMHFFRVERAGQNRGIPEITPALPLFAQLRRYTLAVLAAAETAADFAAVLYTDSPADAQAAALSPMDIVELEKRMATTLPEGWKLGQIEANQPITTYAEFVRAILNEIARCMNIPLNVALGNSADCNYASGRLDFQVYGKAIKVDQSDIEWTFLNPILRAWMDEAILVGSPMPLSIRSLRSFPHQWFWDGREHVDPAKEANAQETRLRNHTTTLAEEYAKTGKDWEQELRQRSIEMKFLKQEGLLVEVVAPQEKPVENNNVE
jgi:lambda family phage portal protein